MPQQPAVQDRKRSRADGPRPGSQRRREAMERARTAAEGAHSEVSVGCATRTVRGLRLGLFVALDLRVPHHVLSPVGGPSDDGTSRALRRNLPIFEHEGGLAMSPHETGVQWDLPYGWAPTQLLAIEGLRRYGFEQDADRISYEFLSTVAENFRRDGTIREKYNVVTRSSDARVTAGYQQNVVGFGWTNGAFLVLLHALPAGQVARLGREQLKPLVAQ